MVIFSNTSDKPGTHNYSVQIVIVLWCTYEQAITVV